MGEVHLAGPCLTVNDRYMRQRCAWCGAVLEDYDLARVAVPVGQDPTPPRWTEGVFVLMDGGMATVVDYAEGDPLPASSCMRLDPEVTR